MPHRMVQGRRLVPGPSDVVFAMVLVLVLAGGRHALFNDPGTYWHLRLGRDILATASAPRCDALTFTRSQEPWVDQSWGFDVLLAVVVDHAGWSCAAALTALGLAWVYASLTRDLIQGGASAVAAVVVALLSAAIGCIHFLIRPHVFTLAFVYLTFRLCRKQYEQGGWAIAWVPVLTAVLANLHGGFVALPLIVACAGVGRAVSGGGASRATVGGYALAFAACCLASLVNPYGLDLHRHVARLLFTSGVTGLIDEYKSAPFGQPEARVLEMAVLALIALPALSNRKIDRYSLVHVLVWLHLALTSIRNAPFFALAVAPVMAGLLDGLATSLKTDWTERPGRSAWPWALAVGLLVLIAARIPLGSPDPTKWPLDAVAVLDAQDDRQRLFHEQDWGGLIASECKNRRLSFIDDRFELFGVKAVLEYVAALGGGPEWDAIRDRERIDVVWIKPDRGLARRLLDDPGWTVAHRGAASIVFRRRDAGAVPRSPGERLSGTIPMSHEP
ncbi:hypothetical protein BSF38_01041 [Paludisphaera borealis]|uniref:Glycosyltransferase RgtA/B/C/D-like domain-containing protein n=2 Tax=Paludisphaera borealis TaxID=1387353 RepID=A0A1U7CKZ6_9BACT|nr:hypothetical protein BSF38_01041 [Paludisphaera borealis]